MNNIYKTVWLLLCSKLKEQNLVSFILLLANHKIPINLKNDLKGGFNPSLIRKTNALIQRRNTSLQRINVSLRRTDSSLRRTNILIRRTNALLQRLKLKINVKILYQIF